MQIEIDFEVFKALTALRENEADSNNKVLRRVLGLQDNPGPVQLAEQRLGRPLGELDRAVLGFGVWFGQVHLPEGTKLRATYKGRTYWAEIKNGNWLGEDRKERRSPSDAAGAISGTNVNGWRFWYAQRPGDPEWQRLDELRS